MLYSNHVEPVNRIVNDWVGLEVDAGCVLRGLSHSLSLNGSGRRGWMMVEGEWTWAQQATSEASDMPYTIHGMGRCGLQREREESSWVAASGLCLCLAIIAD